MERLKGEGADSHPYTLKATESVSFIHDKSVEYIYDMIKWSKSALIVFWEVASGVLAENGLQLLWPSIQASGG